MRRRVCRAIPAVSVFSPPELKPNPVVSTCTTDLVTVSDNSCTDALNKRKGSPFCTCGDKSERAALAVCATPNVETPVSSTNVVTTRPRVDMGMTVREFRLRLVSNYCAKNCCAIAEIS